MMKIIKKIFKNIFSFESRKDLIQSCIIFLLTVVLLAYYLIAHIDYFLTNVITIIISVICSVLATALYPKELQKEEFCKLEDKIVSRMEDIIDKNKYATPTSVYTDTNDPNMEFNEKVNISISETKSYLYFSDRALYLTERLGRQIHKTNNRLSITVLLADVRETALFEARREVYMRKMHALNREKSMKKELTQGIKSLEEIINEEKLEVLRSLYALGKLQEKYDIQVYLHKEIPFIRFEITDNLFVLTFLTKLSTGKDYPSTLLYENENTFRLNFMDYAQEVINRSYHMSREELQLDKLLKLGKAANIKGCNEKTIVSHYNDRVKD